MLLAVLEKGARFKLNQKDVFLNITGGLKVFDPALDMAVVVAVMSSNLDIPVSRKTVFIGEVGLSGEVRAVNRIEQRIKEAEKLGFEKAYIPKNNLKGSKESLKIELAEVSNVAQLIKSIFN